MKRNIDKDMFIKVCNESISMRDACMKLNMAYTTFARYAKKFGCYKTNQGGIGIIKNNPKYWNKEKLIQFISENPEHPWQSYKLKTYLLKYKIKPHICEICKNTVWLDKPISLELHHIDGNPMNNNLDNLQLLCPNCHAQTETYRAKNRRIGAADQK